MGGDLRLVVVSITTMAMLIAAIVVIVLALLVLIIRVGVTMLLMAVAIVVMTLLVARHDRVLESPAANTRSVTEIEACRGTRERVEKWKTRSGRARETA